MVYAIIFAGGVGSRLGSDIPKQFLEINKKPVLVHTVEVFNGSNLINGILIVSKSTYINLTKSIVKKYQLNKVIGIIPGGKTAFESQFNGINYISNVSDNDNDIVLVHDGVRPLINESTIDKCINSVKKNGNAITASPALETVAILDKNNIIERTISRQDCLVARAPQAFYVKDLLEAHLRARKEGKEYIDSASMMLDQNKPLNPVIGPDENIKITTMYDFKIAELLLGDKDEKS